VGLEKHAEKVSCRLLDSLVDNDVAKLLLPSMHIGEISSMLGYHDRAEHVETRLDDYWYMQFN
jgi:hypothetical protein